MILLPYAGNRIAWLAYMHRLTLGVAVDSVWARELDQGTGYAELIVKLWEWCAGHGDALTIIEHDIWPTAEQLAALLASPAPITTIPYDYKRDLPSHWTDDGISIKDPATLGRDGEIESCWWSALGLVRWRPEALQAIKLPADVAGTKWNQGIDSKLSAAAIEAGIPYRVLWPMVRHHPDAPGI